MRAHAVEGETKMKMKVRNKREKKRKGDEKREKEMKRYKKKDTVDKEYLTVPLSQTSISVHDVSSFTHRHFHLLSPPLPMVHGATHDAIGKKKLKKKTTPYGI